MSKKVRKIPRHPFRFKIDGEDGKSQVLTAWAKTRLSNLPVNLILRAEHVRESMKKHGVGNTQTCSMAICAKKHKALFSHPVEGFIDWTYRRAYVVSKTSKETGLPTECYVYNHSDEIALLNDTWGGQVKLLKLLENSGPRTIRLGPTKRNLRDRAGEKRPTGPRTGSKTKHLGHGAKLRFAIAQLGGAPPK